MHGLTILECMPGSVTLSDVKAAALTGRRLLTDTVRFTLKKPLTVACLPHTQPDVSFDSVETLQPVPRLVYGLLRSPVLTQAPDHHPDLHTALRLLWTALPPEELRRAVYPLLSSYTTPDVQVSPAHHVRRSFLAQK